MSVSPRSHAIVVFATNKNCDSLRAFQTPARTFLVPLLTRLVSRHTASSTKTSHAQPNTKSKEHKTIPVITSPSLQLYTFLTWKSCITSPVCTTLSATSNILWEQHTTKWQPHNSNELQKQQTFYARNYPNISLVQELRLFAEVVWEDWQRL